MLERIDYSRLVKGLLTSGYTTGALARAVGLTQPSISRIATGKQLSVSGDVALRLITLAGGEVSLPVSARPQEAQKDHAG